MSDSKTGSAANQNSRKGANPWFFWLVFEITRPCLDWISRSLCFGWSCSCPFSSSKVVRRKQRTSVRIPLLPFHLRTCIRNLGLCFEMEVAGVLDLPSQQFISIVYFWRVTFAFDFRCFCQHFFHFHSPKQVGNIFTEFRNQVSANAWDQVGFPKFPNQRMLRSELFLHYLNVGMSAIHSIIGLLRYLRNNLFA